MLERDVARAGTSPPPREAREHERRQGPDALLAQQQPGQHASGAGGPEWSEARLRPREGIEASLDAAHRSKHQSLEAAFFAGGHEEGPVSDTRGARTSRSVSDVGGGGWAAFVST
ncbi:hypothetical protein MFU01_21980 [Myxococcus fulvus]|uniref:Uncharacterized protein n=1 Tax=Myxococcus fulvus TaxID=33 RepID=A0A511SZ48_MYXFU|nr:hypothetical protein MFU01_21980 [Myxococcus fulvus]